MNKSSSGGTNGTTPVTGCNGKVKALSTGRRLLIPLIGLLALLSFGKDAQAQYSEYYILNKCFVNASSALQVTLVGGGGVGNTFATASAVAISNVVTNINTGVIFNYVNICNAGTTNSVYVDFSGAVATTASVIIHPSQCFQTNFSASSGTNMQISAICAPAQTSTIDWYVQK